MLFISGAADRLCPLPLLRSTLERLRAPYQLHLIDEGDHSFKAPKRTGKTQDDVFCEILRAVVGWLGDLPSAVVSARPHTLHNRG